MFEGDGRLPHEVCVRDPSGSAFLNQAVFSQPIQKRANVLQSRLSVYFESLHECIRYSTNVMPRLQPLPDRRPRLVQRIVAARLQIEQDGFLFVQHRERHVGDGAVVHAGNGFEALRFSGINSGSDKGHAEARSKPFHTPMKPAYDARYDGSISGRGATFSKTPIANKRIPYVFNHINATAFLFPRLSDLSPLRSGSFPRQGRLQKRPPP